MAQNLLQKGQSHISTSETRVQPTPKPGCVRPGGGHNQESECKDALPGFESLESYATAKDVSVDRGQGVYPFASKSLGESSRG